jgi:hypothetical protein
MQAVQQIVPISDFRLDQDGILQMMDKEPVILAQRSKPRAVLVSVPQWNGLIAQLSERRFTEAQMAALALAYQRRDQGGEYVDGGDLKAMMAERHGHVADPV